MLVATIIPLLVVNALPAALAAVFGYHPRYWVDVLNPWSPSFSILEPAFGLADHFARFIYGLLLLGVIAFYVLFCTFSFLTIVAIALSWATTGAFGCLSFRLAIATQWAVEPTPEGEHLFLNAGWSRDTTILQKDRIPLQHSEPYAALSVLESVVKFVEERVGTTTRA